MTTANPETEQAPQVLFRPGKKKKAYRQRPEEPESTTATSNGETATEAAPVASNGAPDAQPQEDESEEGLSVAEVLRRRNLRKQRHGGVGFRAGPSSLGDEQAASEANTEQGMVLHGDADAQPGTESAIVGGITKRFAPQTGLVGDLVNKHM